MLSTLAYFKNKASGYEGVIQKCNELLGNDFHVPLRINYQPDLLMVTKSECDVMVGLMLLHYTESTGAWDIGTVAILGEEQKTKVYGILINGACEAIGVLQVHGIMKRVWLVKRVKHEDKAKIRFFNGLGFVYPEKWTDNFLSDNGYVPFDPFETVLMKREVDIQA